MDYRAISVELGEMSNKLTAEKLEVTARVLTQALEDRGLIQDGVLGVVTESGRVVFGDELDEGTGETGAVADLLDTAVQTAMSEFEADEDQLIDALGAFVDEMVDAGVLPSMPSPGDTEAEAEWYSAAIANEFVDSFISWLSDEGEDEEDSED